VPWDKRGNWGRVLVAFVLLAFALFPLYYMVVTSVKSDGEATASPLLPPLRSIHFENLVAVLDTVTRPAFNSSVASFGTALLVLLLVAPAAYVFTWHRFPGKERIFTLVILSITMPSVLTFVPQFILIKQLGLLNTQAGFILLMVASSVAVPVYLLRTFFKSIPDDLVEAARLDGASEPRILLQVILPLMGPALITVAVLTISAVWNQFLLPLVVLSDETQRVATVAASYLTGNPYFESSQSVLMAAYLMSSLPLVVTMAFLLRYFMSGATAGAIKG